MNIDSFVDVLPLLSVTLLIYIYKLCSRKGLDINFLLVRILYAFDCRVFVSCI